MLKFYWFKKCLPNSPILAGPFPAPLPSSNALLSPHRTLAVLPLKVSLSFFLVWCTDMKNPILFLLTNYLIHWKCIFLKKKRKSTRQLTSLNLWWNKNVVTKLTHHQLKPRDRHILARCSIMGPWLDGRCSQWGTYKIELNRTPHYPNRDPT